MAVACGILVGGLSRRMGRPKALLPVGGATLLERTRSVARSAVGDVVLLGRPPFDLPPSCSGMAVVEDAVADCGPLGGLAAFFAVRPNTSCLLLACDMPALNAELLHRLLHADESQFQAVIPATSDGATHPCCALYRSTAAHAVAEAMATRCYSMHALMDRLRWSALQLTEAEAEWVANWNLPSDVAAVDGVRSARRSDSPGGSRHGGSG